MFAKEMYKSKDRLRIKELMKIIENDDSSESQKNDSRIELSKIHKVWGYRFQFYDELGKRQFKSGYSNNGKWRKSDAQAAGAAMKESLKPTPLNVKEMTFSELFELYVKMKDNKGDMKPRCYGDMRKVVDRHINYKINTNENGKEISRIPYFSDKVLSKITKEVIKEWQIKLVNAKYYAGKKGNKTTQSYSKNQLKKIQTYFNAILNYAKEEKYILENPFIGNDFVTRVQRKLEHTLIEQKEFNQLYAAIQKTKDECKRLQNTVIYSIFFYFGLRKGECLALEIKDYCPSTKILTIKHNWDYENKILTKPKSVAGFRDLKAIPQVDNAINQLIDFYKKIPGYSPDKVLISFEKRLSCSDIRKTKNKYLLAAGLPLMTFHDFRHSYVSVLVKLGFSAVDIAKNLGDTPEMVLSTYAHAFKDSRDRIAEAQNKNFEQNKPISE